MHFAEITALTLLLNKCNQQLKSVRGDFTKAYDHRKTGNQILPRDYLETLMIGRGRSAGSIYYAPADGIMSLNILTGAHFNICWVKYLKIIEV